MATLPAANYLSNAARTEAEMQTALDALRDVVAEIGSTAPTTRTISNGTMPVPNSSMALVQSQGVTTVDDLVTITTTGIDQGRIVILRNANTGSSETSGPRISISHGTSAGQIELADNATFVLCAERLIALIYSGNHWVELWRNYGRKNAQDSLAERTYLGLGTASVETIATGVGTDANSKVLKVAADANLTADAILSIDASGNIKAGTISGGGTVNESNYILKNSSSQHALASGITATNAGSTRFNANTTVSGQNPGFGMLGNGEPRGLMYANTSTGILNLNTYNQSGDMTTVQSPRIRLNPVNARLEFSTGSQGTFQSLRPGPGNGLDADTTDGTHAIDMLNVLSIVSGASGSFRLFDGTTTLLVQWPEASDWTFTTGSEFEKTYTYTFPTAYATAPAVIGSYLYTSNEGAGVVYSPTGYQAYTASTSGLSYLTEKRTGSGSSTSTGRRVHTGVPLVIGVPA